jgi:SAM-dependent MidA family methyltransferase
MKMTLPEPDAQAQAHSKKLQQRIEEEVIAEGGSLPFSRFMQMALYEPGLGYYVAGARKFGAQGDFVTAPELSALFSQCLARQCAEVLEQFERRACILELGAGSGVMAADMLAELEGLQALPDHYYILELSPDLRQRQQTLLKERLPHLFASIRWLDSLEGLELHGVIIANEVLDAMPVQSFAVLEKGIHERGVSFANGAFVWQDAPVEGEGLREQVENLRGSYGTEWPVPYYSEINPQLPAWMQRLSEALAEGAMFLIDYGYPGSEYYHPQRHQGTLLSHYRHRSTEDPFFWPGLQDITASVDFSAVAEAGEAAGLTLAGYTNQANFLMANDLDVLFMERSNSTLQERLELSQQVKVLTLPAEMGERFQVIGFTKALDLQPRGFSLRDFSHRL